jgi:outer membrane biosynthesis protein TonB
MWRYIILSAAGHALVFATLILPSMLSSKAFKPVTVVNVKMVQPQSISSLLEKVSETGEPKPKVPQVNVKPEKALPNPKAKKVQPVKRAAAETEKSTPSGTAGKKGEKDLPKGIVTEQAFSDNEYLSDLVQKIRSNWRYPSLNAPNIKTVVYFRINRDGRVSLVQVKEKSGFMNFDSSTYDAVVKSTPFQPLPESYSGNYLGIYLRFSY